MTSKDQAWVAAKLAKFVDPKKPLTEVLDGLTLPAYAEMRRWCGKRVKLSTLRQRIHNEIIAGDMGTAEGVAKATAVALSGIVNEE